MKDILPPNHNKSPEEGLRMITHCPVCHYSNDTVSAKVLEESDSAHLVYIKCRRCQSAVLALFSLSSFGVNSVGIITDFDSHEVAKFKELTRISSDDVLSIYSQLAGNRLEEWA